MKKCIGAVRYGIETLGVSPDAMFNLISTSKGYSGDNYERWLASKIIEVAEADGVGFSQLLVKKFNILSDMSEEEEKGIKKEYMDFFIRELGSDLYTYGFDEGSFDEEHVLNEEGLLSGVDYDEVNSFFTSTLPDDLQKKVRDGLLPFLFKFDMSPVSKKCDLAIDAKNRGIVLKYIGSAIMYRMSQLCDVFKGLSAKFGFIVPSSFLYDGENIAIVSHFLQRFEVEGYAIPDLSMFSGEYAFCICRTRTVTDFNPVIALRELRFVNEDYQKSEYQKLYSYSSKPMFTYLMETTGEVKDEALLEYKGKYAGVGLGRSKALGYLYKGSDLLVTSNPIKGYSGQYVPITPSNLMDVIAYFGAYKSCEEMGYFTGINTLITGGEKYSEMVYNCLPLFLFDDNSNFHGLEYTMPHDNDVQYKKNKFDIKSNLVKRLYDIGTVHFSFEAKELWGFCKRIIENSPEDKRRVCSFIELLQLYYDTTGEDVLNKYSLLSKNLKGYIISNYSMFW